MIKIRVLVIVTVIFFVTFLYYAVNCQKSTKQAPKNEINLRNIRNKKNNGNGNGGNNSGNNNNNKRNGKNNNRGKNRRNKRIKGKGKNNNNNGGNNNNNNGNSYNDNGFLSIQKGNMVYKKKKVFISGVNIQYISFGKDFGNGGYASVKAQYESWLKQISGAGGNALRILLHTNGTFTPKLDSQGYATGEDTASLIQDLGQFLDTAANYNVFVFITLWNGAMNMTADKVDIYKSDAKLDRYIEKVLKPMVSGLKTKKALGAWEVITTPQGTVRSNIVDSNPCFDTQYLFHQIATFTTNNSTMKDMQKFINKQLDAIKIADPKALRSVISKEEEASEYCDWCYNYWQDKCLTAAGGKPNGVLDYYGLDAVPFSGTDYYWSPLRKMASDYKLNKPILIAMTSGTCSDSKSIVTNYNHAINSGYTGAFGWRYNPGLKNNCNDSPAQCDAGMSAVKNNDMTKINMN